MQDAHASNAQIWVLASDPFHKTNERLRAVTGHGVVLAIRRPDVPPYGFLGLSLVEGKIVKALTLALFWSGLGMTPPDSLR